MQGWKKSDFITTFQDQEKCSDFNDNTILECGEYGSDILTWTCYLW